MNLSDLLKLLQDRPAFRDLAARLDRAGEGAVGLSVADAAKPYALAALHAALGRPMLLLVARPNQARAIRDEIACWHPRPDDLLLFPEQDALPYEPLPPDPQTSAERLAVLTRLVENGGSAGAREPGRTVQALRS